MFRIMQGAAVAAIAGAGLRGCAGGEGRRAGQDPHRLGAGAGASGAAVWTMLAQKHPEVYAASGQELCRRGVRFAGTTPQIQAMAVGELEIAAFAPSSLALAVTNAHLDVRVVSDVIQTGRPGYFDQPYMVRKDGPIKTIEDVKGKRIATNAIGSASDTAMRIMLRKHGIQDSDFTTVEINFANMLPMIEDDKVDLIAVLPQFEHRARRERANTARSSPWARRWARRRPCCGRCARISSRRTARRWSISSRTISARVRWFLDPKHRAEALAIAARRHQAEARRIWPTPSPMTDFYRAPDCMPDMKAAQKRDRRFGEARHPPEGGEARADLCRSVADQGSQGCASTANSGRRPGRLPPGM